MMKIDADYQNLQSAVWKEKIDLYASCNNIEMLSKEFYLAEYKGKSLSDASDNINVIDVRLAFAEPLQRGKYIVLQTFYNFGDLATIDIVKMPTDKHVNLVQTYINSILIPELTPQEAIRAGEQTRYFIAGGFAAAPEGKAEFRGSSQDFHNQISVYDVNDLAAYIALQSGLFTGADSVNPKNGEKYLQACLDLMAEHKTQRDFHSHLIDMFVADVVAEGQRIHPNTIGALVEMKSSDRLNAGEEGYFRLKTEEMVEIGNEIIAKSVAAKIRMNR